MLTYVGIHAWVLDPPHLQGKKQTRHYANVFWNVECLWEKEGLLISNFTSYHRSNRKITCNDFAVLHDQLHE
jgi:hypothetical protein